MFKNSSLRDKPEAEFQPRVCNCLEVWCVPFAPSKLLPFYPQRQNVPIPTRLFYNVVLLWSCFEEYLREVWHTGYQPVNQYLVTNKLQYFQRNVINVSFSSLYKNNFSIQNKLTVVSKIQTGNNWVKYKTATILGEKKPNCSRL